MKRGLLLFVLPLILLQVPACIPYELQEISPLEIARQEAAINDFLNKNPTAEILTEYYTEIETKSISNSISSLCNKTIDAKEIYKINIINEPTKEAMTAWIDWRNQELECFVSGIK